MTPAEKEDIKNIIKSEIVENLTIKISDGRGGKEIEIWYGSTFMMSEYIE